MAQVCITLDFLRMCRFKSKLNSSAVKPPTAEGLNPKHIQYFKTVWIRYLGEGIQGQVYDQHIILLRKQVNLM
jgi:hypothetical protein